MQPSTRPRRDVLISLEPLFLNQLRAVQPKFLHLVLFTDWELVCFENRLSLQHPGKELY